MDNLINTNIEKEVFNKMVKQFDITINDDKKLKNKNIKIKPLPKEWIPEIIKEIIESCKTKPTTNRFENDVFTLFFNNEKERIMFDGEFIELTTNIINKFIINKNENPKEYARSLILECKENFEKLTIQF